MNVKQHTLHTFCLLLALTFITVGSLSIVCAYHHGIDELNQHHQTSTHSTHSTLFCSFLSKLSSQVVITTLALSVFAYDLFSSYSFKVHDGSSFLLTKNSLARSPPTL